jgi:hypothetical protein
MRIVGVIAAALLALAAWYLLRDGDTKATSAFARESAVATRSAPSPPASPALAAVDDGSEDPSPVVDTTHTVMQELGRRCFAKRTLRTVAPGQPDDTVGRLELRLGIRISDGTARVESADVVSTRRLRDDIRDCIVAASRTARWPVPAPDGNHEIIELFRMGDYVAVTRPDSPPSTPPTR